MTASPMMTLYREWQDALAKSNSHMSDDAHDAFVVEVLAPLEEKLLRAPVATTADLLARITVELRYVLNVGSAHEELTAMVQERLQPVLGDPLLVLINEYRVAQAAYRAAPEHEDEAEERAFHVPYMRLCESPPNATTLEGALAAIRLVHEEEATCGSQPDLTTKVLASALAFFDAGGAGPLGRVYRSEVGADPDARLSDLASQFKLDAMTIDPTITGMWTYNDMTIAERDSAFQGLFLERVASPFIRRKVRAS
jgi:hypothetical protein